MSALMNTTELSNQSNSVTAISANARIDYILRFSKHAILVVDDEYQIYSQVASQFLGSLSEHNNAAFLAISPKFNDIQIRCRLIEQLISTDLFDPEVSLALSVVNLARTSKESISIVVEQAHHLSLQLLHELCQLAAIAKKTKLNIQVIMLGLPTTGQIIANNKSLFENKLSILSASSGQLLPLNSSKFKKDNSLHTLLMDNKWLVSLIVFLCCLTAVVFILLQQETFTFSKTLAKQNEQITTVSLAQVIATPSEMVLLQGNDEETLQYTANVSEATNASTSDIYQSILSPNQNNVLPSVVAAASTKDIINALTLPLQTLASTPALPLAGLQSNEAAKKDKLLVDNNYYLADNSGFVIQIAAFAGNKAISDVIGEFGQSQFYVYQRSLNGQTMNVITSERYQDRVSAELALKKLASNLFMRDAWIKAIAIINREIILFKTANTQ